MITRKQAQAHATGAGLGGITFESRVAINSQNGRPMTVGYVYSATGSRELFCKAPSADPENFHLCNEYRALEATA